RPLAAVAVADAVERLARAERLDQHRCRLPRLGAPVEPELAAAEEARLARDPVLAPLDHEGVTRPPVPAAGQALWRRLEAGRLMAAEHAHRPKDRGPADAYSPRVARLPVRKTYKLFIGGAFPRSESGRTYEAQGQNVARASRKDVRDAVVAARAAQPKWAGATAYNRGQVLY